MRINEKENVSVIISTYNSKEYIGKTLDSILQQIYKNIEIIIIDDCSTDGTIEYIKDNYNNENIRIFKNDKKLGINSNRKKAIIYSKGKYIVFLNDKDRFIDSKYIEDAVDTMEKNKKIAIVCGNHISYNLSKTIMTEQNYPYEREVSGKELFTNFSSINYPIPSISASVFRKKVLEKAKYEEMKNLNDSAIFLRTILYGNMAFFNESKVECVVDEKNDSNYETNFIIDNLDEKIKVHKIAEEENKYSKEEVKKWLLEQLDITIIDFIKKSKPNFFKYRKIIKWYSKNINIKEKINIFKQVYKESKSL